MYGSAPSIPSQRDIFLFCAVDHIPQTAVDVLPPIFRAMQLDIHQQASAAMCPQPLGVSDALERPS